MKNLARIALLGVGILGFFGPSTGADEPAKELPAATREFDVQGFHVRVDLSRQVIEVDVPEERGFSRTDRNSREEAPLAPTLAATGGFVSASVLAQKAKQFDDGLYAAVELAAQNGAGRYPGKADLLVRLARAMATSHAERSGNAETILLAACRLGGVPAVTPPGMEATIDSAINEFDADALRSKPIGFYTWSGALAGIFRQDRMLQSELKGKAGIAALARAIHSDKVARASYEGYLALISHLTNPLTDADMRGPLGSLDAGGSDFPSKEVAFFPASRAHETDLVKKLYMGRPIPEGFNLVEEMVRRIRSGKIDLAPNASSGWYDYQTWALETLVAPERATEAARLKFRDSYRKQLNELFKGILALSRETHIKQLEVPAPGEKGGPERVRIYVNPELSIEPLATFYARRAAAYRFVRSALETTFGADAIRGLHRQTDAGPVNADLAAELDAVEAIFAGASATVSRELGLAKAVSAAPEAVAGRREDADREAFRRWSQTMDTDPDIGRDARMMVPVFFDRGRGKTKVSVFLGWAQRPVNFWFATQPTAEVTKNGKPANAYDAVVEFGNTYQSLAYPVTAEVYVERILDRDEFRRHCDRYKTRSEILKNLK